MSLPELLVLHGAGAPQPRVWLDDVREIARPTVVVLDPSGSAGPVFEGVDVVTASDPAGCLRAGQELASGRRYDGVLTMAEQLVVEAARVAADLGLPHHSVPAALRMRDKADQRKALAAAGLRTPRVREVSGQGDLREAVEAVGLPAVLKPRVGMSSMATFKIEELADLAPAFEAAVDLYRRDERVIGRPPLFVLEEFLVGHDLRGDGRFGDQVAVETVSYSSEVSVITVTDKLPLAAPFRETGDVMPSALPGSLAAACSREALAAVRAMGSTHGAAHTELKLTADGPVVIEVNGRLGGTVAELLLLCGGYKVIFDLARVALGERPQLPAAFEGFASVYHPHSPVSQLQLEELGGVDDVLALPDVRDLRVVAKPGTRLDWRVDDTRLVRVLGSHSTVEEAFAMHAGVAAALRPRYAGGSVGSPATG